MSRAAKRSLALALGTVLAAAGGVPAWHFWVRAAPLPEPGEVSVAGQRRAVVALLARRARRGPTPVPPVPAWDGPGPPAPALVREPLSERDAERIYPVLVRARDGLVYDPHTYFRFRGGLERTVSLSYQADQELVFETNGMGFREREEVAPEKPPLRIVVVGDSHTEGYCNVHESYPNRLEVLIEERLGVPPDEVEVLNAGMSGYSFYNYLGMLERVLELGLDVFVVGVYGGNDFSECLPLHHWFRRTPYPECPSCNWLAAVRENRHGLPSAIFLQAFAQLELFRRHPAEIEEALTAATSVTGEIQRLCRERGVRLVLVYVPPMADQQPGLEVETGDGRRAPVYPEVEAARLFHGMTPAELSATDDLADRWLAFARAREITTLDLREVFDGIGEPLYWEGDHHLNVRANELVAEALLELVLR